MNSDYEKLFFLFFITIFYISCQPKYQVINGFIYRNPPNLLVDSTCLDSILYFNVVKYLEKHSATPLGDTIFVRYIFDGDECWSFWNNIPDSGVKKIVARRNLAMDSFLLLRPKISFFEFREPGFNIEKWISLNPRNIIDSNFFLLHNVIKTKSMCGTSIAIFPDRTLIRFLTDPHHELLYATPKEWYKILNTCKQNKNSN